MVGNMKIVNGLGKFITAIAIADAVILIAMMILIGVDIVWRLLGGGVKGGVEIVTMTVPLIVFLGVGYTMLHEMHVRVDVFKVAWFDRVCNVICIAFMILIACMTWSLAFQTKGLGTSSTILHIPRWPFVLVTSIGFFLVALALVLNEAKHYIEKHQRKLGLLPEEKTPEPEIEAGMEE